MNTKEERKNNGAGAALQIPGTFGESIAAMPFNGSAAAGGPETGTAGGNVDAAATETATEHRPAGALC